MIDLNNQCLLIGRKDEYDGKNRIYIEEISGKVNIKDISFNNFDDNKYIKIKDFLDILNNKMDMHINPESLPFEFEKKIPKTNIRSTLPFIFQTQDIIDSKIKLFYEDPKPNHFPVLAGWFGPEYYEILKQIEKLNVSIKNLTKRQEESLHQNKVLISNLKNSLRQHYKLNGIEFDENWTFEYCQKRIKNLEQYTKLEYSNELQKRQDELIEIIDKQNVELRKVQNQIKKIEKNHTQGDNHKLFIDKYTQRAKNYNFKEEYKCPICSKENEQLTISAINIYEANQWLKKELTNIPFHTDNFEKELNEYKKNELELIDLRKLNVEEFNANKVLLDKISNLKNLNEEKQKAQWKVLSDSDIYNTRHVEFNEVILDYQIAQLERLKEKKNTYNENDTYYEAKKIIQEKMSLNVSNLDFEHNPPDLFLDFHPKKDSEFKLYHINLDDETINLNRIGSASNALACHIGLFLSFLSYFAHQPKSKVPSILFLDQPSQVYFPSGKDNTDIDKVGQIYETILDEIQKIEDETGINPQVIIADHVKDLGDENVKLYEHYFKADFRNGIALVPNEF